MKADTVTELEQQLGIITLELGRTRSELRALQQRQRRTARSTTLLYLSSLVVIVLLAGVALSPQSAAQNVAQPSAIVTRLQAPVLVQDKSGQTIVEISDRPGYKGVTVYNSGSDAAFLGFDKQNNGLLQLLGPGRKLFADVSADGFKFFGSTSQSVAFLGADSSNNGALQLKNSAGGVLVDVGAIDANTGFAQVYPRSGKSPFPIPNYIRGSK
ncbi:MAG TPA: hypothetical protein VGJ55_05885 [Pyrinomonadaceae bacterium]|jgi:hypothetical protein